MVLPEVASHGGAAPAASVQGVSVEDRYGDGANLYQYLGSNPWGRSDPMGLFYGQYALENGYAIGKTLYELSSRYAENQAHDAQWAEDFGQPDDWNTREDASWVGEILRRNVEEYLQDQLGIAGYLVQGSSLVGKSKKFLKRTLRRLGYEVHHVMPQYLAKLLNNQSEVLAAIPAHLHKDLHDRLDRSLRMIDAPHMRARKAETERWAKSLTPAGRAKALNTLSARRRSPSPTSTGWRT